MEIREAGYTNSGNDRFPVLIVEDDPVTRRILEKVLRQNGRTVMTAGDGREALAILEEKFFPIIITDWVMPEVDGLALCRTVRAMSLPGYTFIILLTAKSEMNDIISGLDAGADDYLTKPFNQAELLARLRAGTRFLKLYERVRVLSITDPLTQCYNRGYLMKHLSHEIKRSIRYKKSLYIIMSDIDWFKKINDTYGHHAGDVVLKEFSTLIKETIRDAVDWLARYGGEEFVLVLPETDREGAWQVAERIRRLVSEKVIRTEGEMIKITASFGISGFQGSDNRGGKISAETLIRKADKGLYRAKESGRNRVVEEGPMKKCCCNACG